MSDFDEDEPLDIDDEDVEIDPDTATADEIIEFEERKKERAQQVLDDIANSDENN